MWDYSGNGRFQFKNSSQTPTIWGYGDTGNFTTTGKITGASFGAVASSGAVSGTSLSTTGSISGGSISGSSLSTSGNINATGNIYSKAGVTVTNASNQTRVSNWIYDDAGMVYVYNSNGDRNVMLLGYNGHVSCVQVDQSSSRKVKKNIKPIEDAEKILLLDAVSFDYIDESRGTDQRGFIAEDVAEVLPNLVTPETEESTASLNYIGMIPYLQEIIKRQQAQIDYLTAEVEKLKGDK